MYNLNRDFQCFDGSQTIPLAHVNDDYCDCVDGSDEPGKHLVSVMSINVFSKHGLGNYYFAALGWFSIMVSVNVGVSIEGRQ